MGGRKMLIFFFPKNRHVGDGNFHCGIVLEPGEFEKADAAAHRMVHRAIELGGTCTGEHGVGIGKKVRIWPMLLA